MAEVVPAYAHRRHGGAHLGMALSLGCHRVAAAIAPFLRLHPVVRDPMGPFVRAASAIKTVRAARSAAPEKLHSCDALLEQSPEDFQDMAFAFGKFIHEERSLAYYGILC
jgi:hypothetical protein